MKFVVSFLILVLSLNTAQSQKSKNNFVEVGDSLIIGEPASNQYQNINIPRANFIIKKGGIPNFATLNNSMVMVTNITEGENPVVTFRKSNGTKFFRVYKTLSADLKGAIKDKELIFSKRTD